MMFKRAILPLLLAGSLLVPSQQAQAAGCNCGTIQNIVTVAHMQTKTHVSAESANIQGQIVLAAQNIIGTMKINNVAILKAIQDLKETLANAIKGLGVSQEAQKTADLYGDGSQPSSLCGSTGLGGAVQVSGKASAEVRGKLQEKTVQHVDQYRMPVEYLNRILSDEQPDLQKANAAMFPPERTLTPEQVADAANVINTITNPRPTPELTDTQKGTAAGQTYSSLRRVHEARVTFATETLNKHLTYHSPTMPDAITQWATDQWAQAGASGNPPGVVNGKMSEAALFNLLSQMRMGNPNWYMQIATENDTGLLREMALMQAIQLELTRQNNELLDRISVLTAMQYASQMEATGKKDVDAAYARAIGTQQ